MTEIGELTVRIKADAAQLDQEMRRANAVVTQGANGMASAFGRLKSELLALAPAITAAGVVAFGKQAIDAAGRIVDLADRIGFMSGTLSALEVPLSASGASLEEFSGAINRMNNLVGEAAKGNLESIASFDALGLSVDKLRRLSPEEQFYEIASALGKIKDQSTQTEAGMNIFGRGFAVLLPLLKQYEGDMRKAIAAQNDLGNGLDKEALDRIDQFGDAVSEAGIKARNAWLSAFYTILKVKDAIPDTLVKPATNAKAGMPGDNPLPQSYIDKAKSMGMVTQATFVGKEQYGPAYQPPSAKGSNDDLIKKIKAMQDAQKESAKTVDASKKEADSVRDVSTVYDELAEQMRETDRIQAQLNFSLAQGLTNVVFRANSARDAMAGFADEIARAYFQRKIAQPFADSLIGVNGGSGLLDSLFNGQALDNIGAYLGLNSSYGPPMQGFAEGGSPPVGVPSIVGERGPEIFVPNTAGTVIPNNKLGGSNVNVYQTIVVNPGVPELITAKIREAAPSIASAAHAAVFADIERGGKAARAVGRRQ